MSKGAIRRVILFGAIAIISILGMQTYWLVNTWTLKEQEFHQTVHIALLNVAKSIAGLNESVLPPTDLIKRLSSNYYVVNTNSDIDAGELEYLLHTAFNEVFLTVDFEYAIHDCETNEMVYGDFCSYSDQPVDESKLGDLPKPNYEEFTYYFGVKFPSRSGYLLNSMQYSLFLTGILLMTILFFAYSMFVILRQKRLSDMQTDFINNMTHEFKTPISTIKISSEVFLKNEHIKDDPRLYRYATIIKEQNERLDNQVEKVLQIARLERDNFKLNLENINLHEILQNTVQSVELKVNAKNGSISNQLKASKAIIKADKLHLTNIVHNLLDNAIKYCKKRPQIMIKTEDFDNKIRLTIKDEGIGIDKEFQGKIFNKFFRVPTGNVHNVKGFGLGLFYIKNICDAHGWRIDLASEPDEGTEINILISKV